MDVKRFTAAAPEISELIKSLASPVRLRILCALTRQEVSVGALAEALGLSMPTISQHLALLRKDRFVSGRRANQTIFYALADVRIAKIIEGLAEEFCKTKPNLYTGSSPRRAGPCYINLFEYTYGANSFQPV